MAHKAQRAFFEAVKLQFPALFNGGRVLEIGSLDINGSVRDFFTDSQYVGLDIGPGPGVDLVVSGADYDGPDESFDVVVSAECFEHNPVWRETFRNMVRLVKPDGLVLFTCASEGRPEHGTARTDPASSPLTVQIGWNYYKNLNEADFGPEELKGLNQYQFFYNGVTKDLYFIGSKLSYNNVDLNAINWLDYSEE